MLAVNGAPTLPTFCNGGLYIIPRALFSPTWHRLVKVGPLAPGALGVDKTTRKLFPTRFPSLSPVTSSVSTIDYLPIELNYPMGPDRPRRRRLTDAGLASRACSIITT